MDKAEGSLSVTVDRLAELFQADVLHLFRSV